MERQNVIGKVEEYLELFNEIKEKTSDERTALALLQEVNKDMRMAQIREERANGNGNGNDEPATQRQKNFLKKLGVTVPRGLTKREASALIDEELGKESEKDSFREIETNIRIPWYAGNWLPRNPDSSPREIARPPLLPVLLHYQYRLKGGDRQDEHRSHYGDLPRTHYIYGA